VGGAATDDVGDFLGGLGEGHGVGQRGAVVGLVVAVVRAHRVGAAEPGAEEGVEVVERRRGSPCWAGNRPAPLPFRRHPL
jgi:hypothetical protein